MTSSAGIPGDRVCSFVERIERIDEEIKALNEGKKEVFAEAKGEGFDVKALKQILRLRKQDKDERDEQEFSARPLSQSHGERRLVASKGGVAPSRRRTSGSCRKIGLAALQSTFDEFADREGAPSRSHSPSFDQRRRPDTLRTAIAMAFFWSTRTTSLLPRVTPVSRRFRCSFA